MFGISPGQLRHQVDVQQRSTSQDAMGQQLTTWASVATTWAKIEPYQAKEQVQANQVQAEVSHRITLRHRAIFDDPQAAATYRLVFKSRKFNINGAMNLEERGRYSVLLCTEGRSDG
jgi:SPP1 family predicted phage head-tail adaptor